MRTPVSAVRGRRPSPLDDGGQGRASLATDPLLSSAPAPRGCGGIGRRARFRSVWGKPRGGSSPLIRMGLSPAAAEPSSLVIAAPASLAPAADRYGAARAGTRPVVPRARWTWPGRNRDGSRSHGGRMRSVEVSEMTETRTAVGTLVSVNVGMPKDVSWRGKTVFTGVFKEPVSGPRRVRRLNVDGDGQGDLGGHGGEQRAVFVYQLDSYRHWERELGRDDFVFGQFGENFTVDGLVDDEVCIGDRYRIGSAVFEVTQPRVTCYRVGLRMNDPQIPALLVSHGRPGFYFRVLEEGEVTAGDAILKLASGPEQMTVAEVDALLYLPGHPRQQLLRALRIPALSPGWQSSFHALLDGDPGTGNAGLIAASPPPAWPGFRRLAVTGIERECDSVISIRLQDPDGAP